MMEPPPTVLLIHPDRRFQQTGLSALGQIGLLAAACGQARESLENLSSTRFVPDVIVFDDAVRDMTSADFADALMDTLGDLAPAVIYIVASEATGGLTPPLGRPGRDVVFQKPVLASDVIRAVFSVLRRSAESRSVLRAQDLELDVTRRVLTYGGRNVHLTRLECAFLEYLMRHQGHVVPGDALLEGVWGFEPGTGTLEVLRAHLRNLRRKLEHLGAPPGLIRTLPGRGYQIREAPPSP